MVIAGTGHRPDKLNNEWNMAGPCTSFIEGTLSTILDAYPVSKGISGGAAGFDLIWARLCLKRRIPLILAIPFKGHHKYWSMETLAVYQEVVANKLTKVQPITSGSIYSKYQKRNVWMVNNCDLLIGCSDGSEGGTKNCLDYALKVGRPIQLMDPTAWKQHA